MLGQEMCLFTLISTFISAFVSFKAQNFDNEKQFDQLNHCY